MRCGDVQCCSTRSMVQDDGVAIVQYGPSTMRLDGISLRVETDYPYDPEVRVSIDEAEVPFALDLRIPAWAEGATVDGSPVAPGTHRVDGVSAGDVVVLRLPLEPRITRPDSRIDAVRGTIAVERGPFVLCAESVDLPGDLSVNELVVDADAGVEALGAGAVVRGRRLSSADAGWP